MIYDLLITNVILVDGYWDFPYSGSVLIRDGILEVVSACRVSLEAREIFDGGGLYLIPGIVDVNSLYDSTDSEGVSGITTRALLKPRPVEGIHTLWLQDYAAVWKSSVEGERDCSFAEQEIRSRLSLSVSEGVRGISVDLSTFQVSSIDEAFHTLMAGIASHELVLLLHGSDNEHTLAVLKPIIASAHTRRPRVHVACRRQKTAGEGSCETAISSLVADAAQAGLEISCDWYPHRWNISSLPQTVKQLARVPARALGLDSCGIIRSGYRADLVLLSPDETHGVQVHRVWTGGRVVPDMR